MENLLNMVNKTPIEIALGIDEEGKTTARKLYEFLEMRAGDYSRWCKTNITNNPFAEENIDYEVFRTNAENSKGGRPTQDFKLSASFAKKLSMQGKTKKAEQARNYFVMVEDKLKEIAEGKLYNSREDRLILSIIKGENKLERAKALSEYRQIVTTPLLEKIDTQNETIKEQENIISEQDKIITIQKPFVRAAIKLKDTKNTVSMEQAAKLLKYDGIDIGRNGLLKLLREHKILMENNSPYQKYMNMGLFELKICIKETQHGSKMFTVTRVTGKGLIFLNQKIRQWFDMENLDVEI